MGWIDRTTKKRIAELDEHPELNSYDFAKKHNERMKNILRVNNSCASCNEK